MNRIVKLQVLSPFAMHLISLTETFLPEIFSEKPASKPDISKQTGLSDVDFSQNVQSAKSMISRSLPPSILLLHSPTHWFQLGQAILPSGFQAYRYHHRQSLFVEIAP